MNSQINQYVVFVDVGEKTRIWGIVDHKQFCRPWHKNSLENKTRHFVPESQKVPKNASLPGLPSKNSPSGGLAPAKKTWLPNGGCWDPSNSAIREMTSFLYVFPAGKWKTSFKIPPKSNWMICYVMLAMQKMTGIPEEEPGLEKAEKK